MNYDQLNITRPAGEHQESEMLEQVQWITRLRWVALTGIGLAVILAYRLEPHSLRTVTRIAAIIAAYSGLGQIALLLYRQRGYPLFRPDELTWVLYALAGLDLLILGVAIHFTGGVESILVPVYLLYLPAVASLLSRRATYIYASLALALLGTVFGLEYAGWLSHRHPNVGVESGLYREGPFVMTSLIFYACFLYVGAYISSQIASQLRRRHQELAVLNAIARAVSQSLDVEDILEQLYRQVEQLLQPDTFVVALLHDKDETFDVALAVERGERLPGVSARLDQTGGLTAWVLRESRPLLVRDLPAEMDNLPTKPRHITEPARSWLGVPLIARGRIVGALSLQSFEAGAFDRADERFLCAVADQVAMAIDNAQLYEAARRLAVTDGLTGLYNTRHFYRVLEEELARSERYQHRVSLIMFDLDDFKKYNDRYGHLAGDDLLQELAGLITKMTRQTDVVARYGGEEFSIILPETEAGDATKLAERLRATVEGHAFRVPNDHRSGRVTVSVGVAAYPDDAGDVKNLVNCADMALLRAKAGKNRVCVFSHI